MIAAKLSVARLDAAYGQAQVLFDVSLEIGAGEAVALLGRNGAGKSTTFRAILGLIARRSGRIVFDGEDISKHPAYDIVRRGLGYVPEHRDIFPSLTVRQNLLLGVKDTRRPGKWRLDDMLGDATQRIEEETQLLIKYINDELVPAIREHSTTALRIASEKLSQAADHMDSRKKP